MFNSEITEEDILRAVIAVQRFLWGDDHLPPYHFVDTIDLRVHLIGRLFNRMFTLGEFPESIEEVNVITNLEKCTRELYRSQGIFSVMCLIT